jgi:hypothetical protein
LLEIPIPDIEDVEIRNVNSLPENNEILNSLVANHSLQEGIEEVVAISRKNSLFEDSEE